MELMLTFGIDGERVGQLVKHDGRFIALDGNKKLWWCKTLSAAIRRINK